MFACVKLLACFIGLCGCSVTFLLDEPAALHSLHRKADLPLVVRVLNYLVELARGE